MAKYNEHGREIGDDTKVSISMKRLQNMNRDENIAALVAREFSRQAEASQAHETLAESMDFDCEPLEDIFPTSQHEVVEMDPEFMDSEYMGLTPEEIAVRETDRLKFTKEPTDAQAQEVEDKNPAEQTERQNHENTG